MYLRKLTEKVLLARKQFCKVKTENNYLINRNCCTQNFPRMAEKASGKSLSEIVAALEAFAPLSLAESWDNVGLIIDPTENVLIQNVLLTNDLTENVVAEAVKLNTGLIITYHPNIFQGLKDITNRTWKKRIIIQCIKANIAVFSPHTTWDCVKDGVNDWLAGSLPYLSSASPIKPLPTNPDYGAGRLLNLSVPQTIKDAVESIKKHIAIPHLNLALAQGKDESAIISTVALCAGSGSSVLSGVPADLYLTGEMSHHDILEATQRGTHVILCNHSNSERGFLRTFQKKLQEDMLQNQVQVFVSQVDKDPLKVV